MIDEIRLKSEAHKKLDLAANWIISLAEQEKPVDDYIRSLQVKGISNGPMPVAECLMCLTTLCEYRERDLPQPSAELLEAVTRQLLASVRTEGFSGVPYLIDREKPQPDFTDAVCYAAGALTGVLSKRIVTGQLRAECWDVLVNCVKWLISGRIELPADLELTGVAWSWSSVAAISRDEGLLKRFEDKLPPQTYFTSSAFITLSEVLFDLYEDASSVDLVGSILDCLVKGKEFLLSSLFEESRWVGWADIGGGLKGDPEKLARLTSMNIAGLESQQGVILPQGEFNLYALEALSYVRYYLENEGYAQVVTRLSNEHPSQMENFRAFSGNELRMLDEAFDQSLSLLRHHSIERKVSEIQVPAPLNAKEGARFCYYLDGTVGYNALNVLNFYLRAFQSDPGARTEWKDRELGLVDTLLSRSFTDKAFAHCGNKDDGGVFAPAIYATRTAVAALLSWGADRPGGQSSTIPNEVKDIVRALHALVCGEQPTERVGDPVDLSRAMAASLLEIGFLVGLMLQRMNTIDKLARKELVVDIKSPGHVEMLRRENGRKFLRRMLEIAVAPSKELENVLKTTLNQRALAIPYRDYLQGIREELVTASPEARLELLAKMGESVCRVVQDAGDLRFGEMFNDR